MALDDDPRRPLGNVDKLNWTVGSRAQSFQSCTRFEFGRSVSAVSWSRSNVDGRKDAASGPCSVYTRFSLSLSRALHFRHGDCYYGAPLASWPALRPHHAPMMHRPHRARLDLTPIQSTHATDSRRDRVRVRFFALQCTRSLLSEATLPTRDC